MRHHDVPKVFLKAAVSLDILSYRRCGRPRPERRATASLYAGVHVRLVIEADIENIIIADYTGACLPFGLSRSVNAPNPFQIVQNAGYVAFMFEVNNWFHVVPTDNRAMPKDPNPQWFGTSIGRWEGDTLVIETRGFNGWTRLDTIGHPHSDALHLTQTFRRTDADHLAYTVTVDDPVIYTRPWKNERVLTRQKGELIEYSCEENNKDLREGHIKGWIPPAAKH